MRRLADHLAKHFRDGAAQEVVADVRPATAELALSAAAADQRADVVDDVAEAALLAAAASVATVVSGKWGCGEIQTSDQAERDDGPGAMGKRALRGLNPTSSVPGSEFESKITAVFFVLTKFVKSTVAYRVAARCGQRGQRWGTTRDSAD